jgi:hypothetical protein
MKSILEVCLVGLALAGAVRAQDPAQPVLREGIHVQMAEANHAVAIPAADANDAVVVSVTADGRLFLGTQPADAYVLAKVSASTVYVKADARASYQNVLTALDALRGRSIVLLTAPFNVEAGKISPPYGLEMSRR